MQELGTDVQDTQHYSEVRRLIEQLDAECEAARLAMTGFAEVARHERITKRMENIGKIHDELKDIVGEEESVEILVKSMEGKEGQGS